MVHLLFRPAAACSRAHLAIQIQKNSVGIPIQHALELPYYVGVELGNSLLLRGWLGVRRVGDDGGHFSGRAPKPEAAKEYDCGHDRLFLVSENRKARIACASGLWFCCHGYSAW